MSKKEIKILLVDDEPDILEIVGYNFSPQAMARKQYKLPEKNNHN
jgi:hypothetical protein